MTRILQKTVQMAFGGIVIWFLPAFNQVYNSKSIEIPQQLTQQIAKGWHLIAIEKGDLNKDGIDDYAAVVEADVMSTHYTPRISFPNETPYVDLQIGSITPSGDVDILNSEREARELMVFFGQSDSSLKHVFSHSDWIDRADYGGVFGDSFNGILVDAGNLSITSYGGSNWRWSWDMKIRFEDDKWRVIGYLSNNYSPFDGTQDIVNRDFLINVVKIERHRDGEILLQKWADIWMKTKIYLSDARPSSTFAK